MLIQGAFSYVPQNAGIYVRISDDPNGLERGVNRQVEDCQVKADLLGWKVGKIYTENDTSAFHKKKTALPDGRVEWRVPRPEWRTMLEDLYHGRIDGIIVYDQDRLYSPDEVAAEWKQADTAGKRAILSRSLVAIEVKPSAAKGRAAFDHTAIVPIPRGNAKR